MPSPQWPVDVTGVEAEETLGRDADGRKADDELGSVLSTEWHAGGPRHLEESVSAYYEVRVHRAGGTMVTNLIPYPTVQRVR